MKKMKVDLEAVELKGWCHGVLSFDLKIGGIPESHSSNEVNVEFFREIFGRTVSGMEHSAIKSKILKRKTIGSVNS
jgi:hypothetical protein